MNIPVELNNLVWHVIHLQLKNIRYNYEVVKEHPISILNAIVKSINSDSKVETIFFQFEEPLKFETIKVGSIVRIKIILCNQDERNVTRFIQSIYNYFSSNVTKKNFEIIGDVIFKQKSTLDILKIPLKFESNECCIEFITPTTIPEISGKPKTYFDGASLYNLIAARIRRLFNITISSSQLVKFKQLDIISHTLTYSSNIKHISKSSGAAKNIQWIKGCKGNIYIRNLTPEAIFLLLLGSEFGFGTRLSNAQGQFHVLENHQPFFDQKIKKFTEWKEAFNYLLETNENFSNFFQLFTKDQLDEWIEKLYSDCIEKKLTTSPTQAFTIKSDGKKSRRIETLPPAEQLLHLMLYRVMRDNFDKLFERESIGFRKGVSRDRAATLIEQALKNGFSYIIRTDIETFFPNINHQLLKEKIDKVIPICDTITRHLLETSIQMPYKLNNKVNIREKGLSQGSPLSPLLANLYLDSFDEKVKSLPVRYVRYADDFILLTKTHEDALKLAYTIELLLAEDGLRLEKNKTFILDAKHGFDFIGLTFIGGELLVQKEEEIKTLKQPLYITEPYVSLMLAGQSIEIRKDKKIFSRFPLQAISEIIIMEKASFSTSFIKKCVEMNIPITSVLQTGYHVTTIKPDNKQYYEMSAHHSARMAELSEKDILAIAKEIAGMKFRNYLPVFKQRYGKGTVLILNRIESAIEKINQASSLNELRGIEGYNTKELYAEINHFIKEPGFKMLRRDRIKPDAINSLMNFGSYLLFTRINTILRALGLNPYLGFLHSQNERYETLVADLQEIFRGRLHRFLLRIINLKLITLADFTETTDGLFLIPEARKKFLLEFEAELNRKMNGSELTWKEQIYWQALIVKRWAKDFHSLTFIQWKI
ncbi:MAG: CRISPR-associated endonuclease Cas1 [Bacteroidia bacterium]|nr:CRISPR-associated endonuclease Cas1 [Bacteroidia bacterium]